jgi:hypothetical protein
MATLKLYLQNATIPYAPTTHRGAWDLVSQNDFALGTTKAGAAGTQTVDLPIGLSYDTEWFRGAYILPTGMVFSGTVSGVIGLSESDNQANAYLHLHVFVLTGESDTLRGTLWTDYIDPDEASDRITTGGEGFSGTLSEVAASAGDVLVVEIGTRSNTTTTKQRTMVIGGTGADMVNNGDATGGAVNWIQFNYTATSSSVPVYMHHLRNQGIA